MNELANVAGASRYAINVELDRLKKYGILANYVHGKYGLAGRVTPEALLRVAERYPATVLREVGEIRGKSQIPRQFIRRG